MPLRLPYEAERYSVYIVDPGAGMSHKQGETRIERADLESWSTSGKESLYRAVADVFRRQDPVRFDPIPESVEFKFMTFADGREYYQDIWIDDPA